MGGSSPAWVPYEGGESVVGHTFIGAEESAQIWAEHNECNPKGQVQIFPNGNKEIVYVDCIDGKKVYHFGVKFGDHGIAGLHREYLETTWELFATLLNPEGTSSPS